MLALIVMQVTTHPYCKDYCVSTGQNLTFLTNDSRFLNKGLQRSLKQRAAYLIKMAHTPQKEKRHGKFPREKPILRTGQDCNSLRTAPQLPNMQIPRGHHEVTGHLSITCM